MLVLQDRAARERCHYIEVQVHLSRHGSSDIRQLDPSCHVFGIDVVTGYEVKTGKRFHHVL